MFFKVIKDGVIIEIQDKNELTYIKTEATSGKNVRANKDDPDVFGVLSSDCGMIYAIVECQGYQKVDLVDGFDSNEYAEIQAEIDAQRTVVYEEQENEQINISALKSVLMQQQAEQLMDLLQIITEDLSDELIVKYPAFVEKWEEGKSYGAGKRLSYNGDVYKVTKSIGTSGATPDNSAAYYTKLN